MALDLDDLSSFSTEQKEAIAFILREIEETEPFGPGVSYDWAEDVANKLRLTKPSTTVLNKSEMYRRLTLLSEELNFKVHELTDPNGHPIITITGNTPSLDKLFTV